MILSGDRHISEISEMKLGDDSLIEITSSGLTHSWEDCKEKNRYRISPLVTQTSFGLLTFDWHEDAFELKAQLISTNGEILHTHSIGTYEFSETE